MTKARLRQLYLAKRRQLTGDECDVLSRQLLVKFSELDLSGVNCIHLFLPIEKNNEPNTYLIRDWLKTNRPEINIAFPKTDFGKLTMASYADDAGLLIKPNHYGIPEPVDGNLIATKEIDMVILPMLAFDKNGYRVGYGKGFYDRFAADCKAGTQFIGLSFFSPVDGIDDVNEYDVRMHACLTLAGVFRWE